MKPNHPTQHILGVTTRRVLIPAFLLLLIGLSACTKPLNKHDASWLPPKQGTNSEIQPTEASFGIPTRDPNRPQLSPTPDAPHPLPTLRSEDEQYVVQPGDTLGEIAIRYSVPLETIIEANNISNPNILEIGQVLTIPAPQPISNGPAFKIIPDSELVYSPATVHFDLEGFVNYQNGYLARYSETIEDRTLSGVEIVEEIAASYSVNPRLLLALLEYHSEWLTNPDPHKSTLTYPLGWQDPWREGLYRQLSWVANELNRGYYMWRVNSIAAWTLADGTVVPIDPTINAGTAALQYLFARYYGLEQWWLAVSENGFITTYLSLYGFPFDYAIEPLVPPNLEQPPMRLPFEDGVEWAFTGGPHGGWGDGSAWAALDFAPANEPLGCTVSNAWVVAVADGLIVRTGDGQVIQDLDSDGYEQTGWVVLYMHIESRDRVKPGTFVKAGERIGHPSCEGGWSTGTHVHLARRYNGEWIPADQHIPFNLDGWISSGDGNEYDGYLTRNGVQIEAWNGRSPQNTLSR